MQRVKDGTITQAGEDPLLTFGRIKKQNGRTNDSDESKRKCSRKRTGAAGSTAGRQICARPARAWQEERLPDAQGDFGCTEPSGAVERGHRQRCEGNETMGIEVDERCAGEGPIGDDDTFETGGSGRGSGGRTGRYLPWLETFAIDDPVRMYLEGDRQGRSAVS